MIFPKKKIIQRGFTKCTFSGSEVQSKPLRSGSPWPSASRHIKCLRSSVPTASTWCIWGIDWGRYKAWALHITSQPIWQLSQSNMFTALPWVPTLNTMEHQAPRVVPEVLGKPGSGITHFEPRKGFFQQMYAKVSSLCSTSFVRKGVPQTRAGCGTTASLELAGCDTTALLLYTRQWRLLFTHFHRSFLKMILKPPMPTAHFHFLGVGPPTTHWQMLRLYHAAPTPWTGAEPNRKRRGDECRGPLLACQPAHDAHDPWVPCRVTTAESWAFLQEAPLGHWASAWQSRPQ